MLLNVLSILQDFWNNFTVAEFPSISFTEDQQTNKQKPDQQTINKAFSHPIRFSSSVFLCSIRASSLTISSDARKCVQYFSNHQPIRTRKTHFSFVLYILRTYLQERRVTLASGVISGLSLLLMFPLLRGFSVQSENIGRRASPWDVQLNSYLFHLSHLSIYSGLSRVFRFTH